MREGYGVRIRTKTETCLHESEMMIYGVQRCLCVAFSKKKEDMRGTRDARASGELLKKRKWIVRTGGTAFGQNWCEIAPSFVIGMTCSVTYALFPGEFESDEIINRGFCEYGIFLY